METLSLSLEHEQQLDVGYLLAAVFNREETGEPFYDGYVKGSRYLVCRSGSEVAGLVRLSPWPLSPMQEWLAATGAPDPFTRGPRSIELTGGVVAEAWRRRGISRLLLNASMLYCAAEGFASACASAEPGSLPHPMLVKLGFRELGEPLVFGKDKYRIAAVPLEAEIGPENQALWQSGFDRQLRAYEAEGLHVDWLDPALGLAQQV